MRNFILTIACIFESLLIVHTYFAYGAFWSFIAFIVFVAFTTFVVYFA